MFGLSFWEVAVIVTVALLVLGPQRLPGLINSVGKALRGLRDASEDVRRALDEPLRDVRQPLNEIRRNLNGVVEHVHTEIVRSASTPSSPTPSSSEPTKESEPEKSS